ncbi:RING/U-box superfamily protein [Perilla frutescens var. frutescens]|nr:RING/U-box superfamily protein [Perilla frutescens var. frutescens]
MFLATIIHEGSMACYRYRHRLLLDPSDITVPATYANKTSGSYNGDASFDGNMVIILAALLCALLCALGLNSVVRCFLRCSTTYVHESPDEVAAATGLKKEALSRIPVVPYKAGMDIPATDCPICIGEFVEGEDVRFFPRCNHGFHVKCIDRWLILHSSCPTCRQPLFGLSSSSSTDHVRIQIS